MVTSNRESEKPDISPSISGGALCPACFAPSSGEEDPCPECGYSASRPEEGDWNRLKPGTVVNGRYVVGRPLGQGGFGITDLGMDLLLNTKLAIKEYFPSGAAMRNPSSRAVLPASEEVAEDFQKGMEKFIEEARTLARFEGNPSIVSVRDFFEENGTAYMVMNHLEGRTLLEHIKDRGGRLPFGEALGILSPLMDALDEIHASGLIHRDISPDNIFLTRFGQVKLLDFGASKTALALMQQSRHSVVLKKGYSPAEQYLGSRRLGPWSDVYGMAATLYRCIAGMPPPDALDRMEEDSLEPPSRMGAAIPWYAEAALLRALSVPSEKRPQSMREFKEGLLGELIFSGSGEEGAEAGRRAAPETEEQNGGSTDGELTGAPLPERRKRRQRSFSVLPFLLLVLLLALGAFSFFALSDLGERAGRGEASAQRSLARLHEIGGIFGSRMKAAEWYRRAAEQGDASAQFALGRMHAEGVDGPPEYAKTLEWYEKAAAQGHVLAQFTLGFMHEHGRGVPRDDLQASRWYRRAAELGDARAQYSLALLSEQGRGLSASDAQAAEWYRRAAEQGHASAQSALARMYEQGRGVMRSDARAAEWYEKAADKGEAEAQYILGAMYEEGRGIARDEVKAAELYRKAAEQGIASAQFALGTGYGKGSGVPQDDAKAAEWYRRAAEQGHAGAQFALGWSYEFGRGVFRSSARAAEWYRRAAERGHEQAGTSLQRVTGKTQ